MYHEQTSNKDYKYGRFDMKTSCAKCGGSDLTKILNFPHYYTIICESCGRKKQWDIASTMVLGISFDSYEYDIDFQNNID